MAARRWRHRRSEAQVPLHRCTANPLLAYPTFRDDQLRNGHKTRCDKREADRHQESRTHHAYSQWVAPTEKPRDLLVITSPDDLTFRSSLQLRCVVVVKPHCLTSDESADREHCHGTLEHRSV